MITVRTTNTRREFDSLNEAHRFIDQMSNLGQSTCISCDSCQAAIIQGVFCHESGCPNAWRDKSRECKWCGSIFTPEARGQECCDDKCSAAYNG